MRVARTLVQRAPQTFLLASRALLLSSSAKHKARYLTSVRAQRMRNNVNTQALIMRWTTSFVAVDEVAHILCV